MLKTLIKTISILLLLITISFGQDILTTNQGNEYKGEMIGAGHYIIRFKAEEMPSIQNVKTESIKSLILSDGTEVVRNGYLVRRNSTLTKENLLKELKGLNLSTIGGVMIGGAGALLYFNNRKTLNENATLEEIDNFADEQKSTAELSYILLAIGGFLIAIDND